MLAAWLQYEPDREETCMLCCITMPSLSPRGDCYVSLWHRKPMFCQAFLEKLCFPRGQSPAASGTLWSAPRVPDFPFFQSPQKQADQLKPMSVMATRKQLHMPITDNATVQAPLSTGQPSCGVPCLRQGIYLYIQVGLELVIIPSPTPTPPSAEIIGMYRHTRHRPLFFV